MRHIIGLGLIIALCLSNLPSSAQSSDVVVPDLRGLSVPQAAAALNAADLELGGQAPLGWTLDSGLAQNSVSQQSIAAGSSVAPGTGISVVVLRAPNMQLIYDDNDLTLLNMSDENADLSRLSFADENNAAFFAATRLSSDLRPRQCLQLWSIGRNGPKGIPECEFIQSWLSTRNSNEHFWTQSNGIEKFAVLGDGVSQVSCPAAGPGTENNPVRCEFFYEGAGEGSTTAEYIYFAYTLEAIAIINMSPDRWMLTNDTSIFNFNPAISNPGAELRFGDPQLMREEFRRSRGNIQRLAPGQCIVFTSSTSEADAPPQPCTVVAQRTLNPDVAFWLADFQIQSSTTGQRLGCPAAIAERPTLCILPR